MDEATTKRRIECARTNMKIAVALSDYAASDISVRAGLSINTLGKFMRGDNMINLSNLQAICDVLNIPLALIASEQQISPARIRLVRKIMAMNDKELAALVEREGETNPPQSQEG